MGQERSLTPGTKMLFKAYEPTRPDWDHDHCSFCQIKFAPPAIAQTLKSEDVQVAGYATTSEFVRGAGYEWICEACWADFADEFGLILVRS